MAGRTFRDVLDELAASAQSNVAQGQSFERLVKAFLERDKAQSQRFRRVWHWTDWPGNAGRHDIGIDLVAEERDSGQLVAIQCKFYTSGRRLIREEANKFLGAYGTTQFASGIIVSTSGDWTDNAEDALRDRDKQVLRWGPDVFEHSSIDWSTFGLDRPDDMERRPTKTLRDYQHTALNKTVARFREHDRGKLIMACGSGKTFTALRIAEHVAGVGGAVLFLTPSISLLSQSLIDWANDADLPLKPLAVCSDIRAGRRSSDDEDISPYDLTEYSSTDPAVLVERFKSAGDANGAGRMTAIFSTYQSLDVVSQAQREFGLPAFDLIVCDEAHRTTGVSLAGQNESGFQRIHDNEFIAGRKRLYMTATPRIYGDRAKRKANESQLTVASMDDESQYGPEFHRLGFGQAIELGILSPYKVIIFNVDQEQVGLDLNELLSDAKTNVNMDNGARMVGCWNGLGKRAAPGVDFSADPQPAKRAVAFSNTIKHSKDFEKYFPAVIDRCITAAGDNADTGSGSGTGNRLRCRVQHVDGTQNALYRAERLAWLRKEPEQGVCNILTNARCLTEGVDVPALDAILFLHPRKSDIDVVQAVGRVMRRAGDKKCGYIILPIAQAPGATAQETVSSSDYKAVWQVINAISAHDDRFEAKINQLALTVGHAAPPPYGEGRDIGRDGGSDPDSEEEHIQGTLLIAGSSALRDAILAKIVDKYADPGYWEKWATNIRDIAARHEARIRALLVNPAAGVRPLFDRFLTGIRHNLNDGITEDDAIGMLSQHLVTKPVFDALFEDYAFAAHNPVSQAMQRTLDSLEQRGLEKETAGLESFYRDVRLRARGVNDAAGKQKIIKELYERFFSLALKDTAKSLGIVYTPTEVVDYIVRSVEDVLQREFGVSVSDEGVHVLDPFVGTGTFITRLLQSGLIKPEDLPRKYKTELHANDMLLLAYYIAAINIEATYHDLAGATEYTPFNGITLTDTLQAAEQVPPMVEPPFPRNDERIARQNKLDIRVIIGNPPWSRTNNRAYPTIDNRVREHYGQSSSAKNLVALHDPYVRAIRQASDRVLGGDKGGIVAFVTNGGFIDSNAFDGFRKAVAEEFHAIYCFNLRGDQRTAGEKSKQEGGKIFGSGSRAGVAILLLVKKPGDSPGATIYYRDIGDYLKRERKLNILADSRLATTDWRIITPNKHHDWIDQRSDTFPTLRPLASDDGTQRINELAPIFNRRTLGLTTNRDAWCYNASGEKLRTNIHRSVAFYNAQFAAFQQIKPMGNRTERISAAKAFVTQDEQQFHWHLTNYTHLARGRTYTVDDASFTVGTYRPFFKQRLYFNRDLNTTIGQFPEIYPNPDAENLGMFLTGLGSPSPFLALMTNNIPERTLPGAGNPGIYLFRWRYAPATAPGILQDNVQHRGARERISNINSDALAQFRAHYRDQAIIEDDLFYYTYGVVHSPQWREAFANDLRKSHARIPMAASGDDFRAFVAAGRELADLHVSYETVEPWPLQELWVHGWDAEAPGAYRVEKMSYAGRRANPDKSRIIYNAGITLAGIPAVAHEYRLGSRSALDWLIDRYQVRTHKASGIVNDPNDWCAEHNNPRYILDLVKHVTTVSVRTVEIVRGLPAV